MLTSFSPRHGLHLAYQGVVAALPFDAGDLEDAAEARPGKMSPLFHPERQDLRVFIPVAHRQQSQKRERVGHAQESQSEQHGQTPVRASDQVLLTPPSPKTVNNLGQL
jgi:hypothetical protein